MSRRNQSTSAQISTAQPFQLYHENISGGKRIEGAKRHLRWRFGWTDSDLEHEVNLKHSLTSGKKVVIEDGREITTSTNLFASEFSHGWVSNGHMFRVEMSVSLSEDPVYVFSIDGVRFEDFIRKPAPAIKRSESTSSNGSVPQRRAEEAPARKPAAAPASASQDFDPFADSTSAPANAIDPFAPNPAKSKPAASNGFDAFAAPAETKPVAAFDAFAAPAQPSSAAFDPFTSPAKPAATTSSFDAFSSPAKPVAAPSTFDAFSSSPAPPKPAASNFDPFAPSLAPAQAADPFATTKPVAASAPKNFDPFGAPTSAPAAKRNSAVDIMGDFAGLEYVPPPPVVMLQDNNKQIGSRAPAPQQPAPSASDPWSSLVNLDLNAPASGSKSLASSGGPSLNSQIKTTGGGISSSPASFSMPATINNDPFGMASPAPLNPFGGPPMGAGMGAAPSRPMSVGPGMGMGPMGGVMGMGGASAAPINPFGGSPMGPGMGGMGGGSSMGMPPMGGGMGMGMGMPAMGNPGQQQQFGRPSQPQVQSKSSLDSLDWKM